MSYRCFPILYFNMSGEMLYILEQRLKNLDDDKSTKVIKQIVEAMMKKKFLNDIFLAQELPTRKFLRTFFEKLAHSSIMRLNESSMDKLFDLMTMTAKYQVMNVAYPEQLLEVTVNHLLGIKAIMPKDTEIAKWIDDAHTTLINSFKDVSPGEWYIMKCMMLAHLQGLRIRVSLMLREKKQRDDGSFYLFVEDEPIPIHPETEQPGESRYYENGIANRKEKFTLSNRTFEHLPVKDEWALDSEVRTTILGGNMYKQSSNIQIKGGGGASKMEDLPQGDELKLLENLFGQMSTAPAPIDNAMDLNMFDDDTEEKKYVKDTKKDLAENIKRINMKHKTMAEAMDEMKIDTKVEKSSKSKGQQMLDLLDEAASEPAKPKITKKSASPNRARSASKGASVKERTGSASAARKSASVKK